MRIWIRALAALALISAVSACAKVQAKTPAPAPLETPAPPPRVVVPVVLPPAPEPPAPATQPPAAASSSRPPATPPSATTAAPPVKPPDKPAATPETPPAPPSSDVIELEKKTRQLLADAQRDLDRVVANNLNSDARAQYDQAKKFITQAQDGLKKKYYLYALGLAEKAANLAAQLPKGLTPSLS